MNFAIVCWDRADTHDLRDAFRARHLQYVEKHRDCIQPGYPLEVDDEGIAGTLFIVDVPTQAAAGEFAADEPFHKAGVYEFITIEPWQQEVALCITH